MVWKIIACLAFLAVASAGTATRAQDLQDKQAAYKALTGIDFDPSDAPPVALGAWPGGPPEVLVVAALDDADADGSPGPLGTVRVGLVARRAGSFALVASDEHADYPEPERTITPSVPCVGIDRAVFRIAPAEIALGVHVSESLTTTSTEAGASTLVLYRRLGSRLVPVFSASTDEFTLDKTDPHARTAAMRHIVRFHLAYDARLL